MDRLKASLLEFLKNYRYPAVLVLLGLVLLLIPGRKADKSPPPVSREPAPVSKAQELEQILSQVAGAGRVRVLLSEAEGREMVFQQNEDVTPGTSSVRRNTVTVTGADRQETGLVRKVIPERYLGAVIVCQGADLPGVRLQITQAVSRITGIGADRISVLKMK